MERNPASPLVKHSLHGRLNKLGGVTEVTAKRETQRLQTALQQPQK